LTIIDRHYGHLARGGREHAVALLDAFARETAAWTPGGRRNALGNPLGESVHALNETLNFGAVDV